jgi:ABC-2 type transport system permease protein
MRRFLALFRKEFRQIRRDRLFLGMLIFVPALLLMLYGYALSFDVKHVRLAILDLDKTPSSRALIDGMFGNPYFTRVTDLHRLSEADALLDRGKVRGVLYIPRGYERNLLAGRDAPVQFLVDGANANSATTAIGYFDLLTERVTRDLRFQALQQAGLPTALPIVQPEGRVWFNPELRSAHFLVPGLIGMLLMLSAVIATALSIVREKERETLEQIRVSPVRPSEWIAAKTIPYILICLVTMVLVLILAYVLFGVRVRGSWFLLSISTVLFLFAALALGVLISTVTRTQQMAFQVAVLISLLPSIVLSGLIFPISNMPLPVQTLTLVVIPRYFVSALRKIILKDAPMTDLWLDWLGLLVLGILLNLIAAFKTRKAV